MDFFKGKQEMYNRSINNLYNYIKNDSILQWFKMYFGYQLGKYSIILGMQNGYGVITVLTVTNTEIAQKSI